MIGVAVQPAEQAAARELFELCKTPWEFFRREGRYEVVICTSAPPPPGVFPLTLVFSGESTAFDVENKLALGLRPNGMMGLHAGNRFPLYGPALTLPSSPFDLVREDGSREPLVFATRATGGGTVVRVGYNLFGEIHRLLTAGQPSANAGIPTLDLHLTLLRDLITRAGLPLVEIPPVPAGFDFMVCLTHDIDHPVLRNHRWDRTTFGFLYRATIRSTGNFFRGRRSLGALLKNWAAALRLPLVQFGLAADFWRQFAQQYLEIEAGLGVTYYFIPERDNPGRKADGSSSPMRACRYELAELAPELKAILDSGNEVGVHGLDAWRDVAAGRRERSKLSHATGSTEFGVRMHWLYFDGNSPVTLDQAGYSYDSTVGYNDTVGYKAGTTQVYQPPGTLHLLELPLHVMDTALFYPDYLHLEEEPAFQLLRSMLDRFSGSGGVLTINWHDRSLAPERLWGEFYLRVLQELKARPVWFATASKAVAWFRKRRNATIEVTGSGSGRRSVRGRSGAADGLPGLQIRIHQPVPRAATDLLATGKAASYCDVMFDKTNELTVDLSP